MKKYSPALREIAHKLKQGYMYGTQENNVRFPYFNVKIIWDGKYWCWRHYGSSANKATLSELQWVLSVIFECSPEEFLRRYECRPA